jgi:hypothetical protein
MTTGGAMRDARLRSLLAAAVAILTLGPSVARAGEADVVAVEIAPEGEGRFRFDVTVRHGDEGWDHYADRWEVHGPDGTVLGTRILLHPHENEQPFTRSLAGVAVPQTAREVAVRAHDKVHGFGGREMTVVVPR